MSLLVNRLVLSNIEKLPVPIWGTMPPFWKPTGDLVRQLVAQGYRTSLDIVVCCSSQSELELSGTSSSGVGVRLGAPRARGCAQGPRRLTLSGLGSACPVRVTGIQTKAKERELSFRSGQVRSGLLLGRSPGVQDHEGQAKKTFDC